MEIPAKLSSASKTPQYKEVLHLSFRKLGTILIHVIKCSELGILKYAIYLSCYFYQKCEKNLHLPFFLGMNYSTVKLRSEEYKAHQD